MPRDALRAYDGYDSSRELREALREDVALRFSQTDASSSGIAWAVVDLVGSIAEARNVARF